MFEKQQYEHRLAFWAEFRNSLETATDPIQDVIDLYRQPPMVSIHVDAYNRELWPDPWELVHNNQYCDFSCVLGMCYSLQLTDRFNKAVFEIHICTDGSLSTLYLLKIDDNVIGWDEKTYVKDAELPSNYASQTVYSMPPLL